jgi:transcription antitermination factor NusA-like protein
MAIARDAGFRSKVAVISRQHGVDPIGACVGPRGGRIQNIVTELGGERIDILRWDPNEIAYAANAISPAQVISIGLNSPENTIEIGIPDRQMALAIGKEGQNARLAAKLIGRRVSLNAESTLLESGADLIPPPEPNMEAIMLSRTPATRATDLSDDDSVSTGLLDQGASGAVQDADDKDSAASKQLTPEMEILAAFAPESDADGEVVTADVDETEITEITPEIEEKASASGIRFGDQIEELRREEEEIRPGKKGQNKRKRGQDRGPARQSQGRRFDYDEDEIEAALSGDDYFDEEFDI